MDNGSKGAAKMTAGLDLGDKYSYLCLLDDESGEVIEEGRLRTTPEAFERRFGSDSGWPLGDTKVSGRRVTCKAPLAHLEEGSGRSKTSPTAILQCTHSLEEVYSEVSDPRGAWSGAEALPRCGGTRTPGRTRASAARRLLGGERE